MPQRPPTPAYLPEAPLTGLGGAELLLLTLWRLHAAAASGCGRAARWQGGLAAAGLGAEARRDCHALFTLLAAAAPGLAPRPPRCPRLGTEEGRLLQLIGLLQRGHGEAARALLHAWLPPDLARQLSAPAEGLARALAARQLAVPARRAPPPWPLLPPTSDRGLTLRH